MAFVTNMRYVQLKFHVDNATADRARVKRLQRWPRSSTGQEASELLSDPFSAEDSLAVVRDFFFFKFWGLQSKKKRVIALTEKKEVDFRKLGFGVLHVGRLWRCSTSSSDQDIHQVHLDLDNAWMTMRKYQILWIILLFFCFFIILSGVCLWYFHLFMPIPQLPIIYFREVRQVFGKWQRDPFGSSAILRFKFGHDSYFHDIFE